MKETKKLLNNICILIYLVKKKNNKNGIKYINQNLIYYIHRMVEYCTLYILLSNSMFHQFIYI